MAISEIEFVRTKIVGRTIVFEECFSCGIPVSMTPSQRQQFYQERLSITCVLGHSTIVKESEVELLQQRLKEAQGKLTKAETTVTNLNGLLNVTEKKLGEFKKAAKNGQCPHCGEYFADLHRHVRRQHS